MSYLSSAEIVLTKLGIHYRRMSLPECALYFCRDANRVTFNLEISLDKCIHIWRFIQTDLPYGETGMKATYAMGPRLLGLEITEEHDLNFFSKQKLTTATAKDICECLSNQITEFLRLNEGLRNRYKEVVYA